MEAINNHQNYEYGSRSTVKDFFKEKSVSDIASKLSNAGFFSEESSKIIAEQIINGSLSLYA